MKYIHLVILLILPLIAACQHMGAQTAADQPVPAGSESAPQGQTQSEKLFVDAFLYGDLYDVNIDAINIKDFPEEVQGRAAEFIARYKNFNSLIKEPAYDSDPSANFINEIWYKKSKSMEHSIVSLINTTGIEELAADYAGNALIYYEWEGQFGPPINEGRQAVIHLNAYPDTPLSAYLIPFIIHRYSAALESLNEESSNPQYSNDPAYLENLPVLTSKVEILLEIYLDKAENHPDPLVNWLANQIRNR